MSENASGNNRIVVDWDGTCVEVAYPAMGAWLPGAVGGLHKLLAAGRDVTISSTRLAPTELDEVTPLPLGQQAREYRDIRAMLDEAGLEAVTIWVKPWKPGALAYVDDKAVPFMGDWDGVTFQLIGG
jgi:hypothetical protein